MNILYSDHYIVVAEKPAGVASQKSEGENMLSLLEDGGMGECFPVHRLDTATAGIMVYARTQRAAALLSQQFAEHKTEKKYFALVRGTPEPPYGEYTDLLFHDRQKNKSYVVNRLRGGVKEARLSYETVNSGLLDGKEVSLVDVTLFTGRTHQIRVQFSHHGHSLIGDGKYGLRDGNPLMLFCHSLSFTHPKTGERLSFSLPCPFSALIG